MRQRLKIVVVALAFLPLLAVFTNFGVDFGTVDEVGIAVAEAARLQAELNSKRFPPAGEKILQSQIEMVASFVSGRISARDCADLHSVVPTLSAGIYVFYPTGETLKPQRGHCDSAMMTRLIDENGVMSESTTFDAIIPIITQIILSDN
jgi:hypothetical protein